MPSQNFSFDLTLLAIVSALSIYIANARLTIIGWLIDTGKHTDKNRRDELKRQINALDLLLNIALLAAILGLISSSGRIIGLVDYIWIIEIAFASSVMLMLTLFSVFHFGLRARQEAKETVRRKAENLPDLSWQEKLHQYTHNIY